MSSVCAVGDLNDRCVKDPLLRCRRRPGGWADASLPMDEVEPLRSMRFVCNSPTGAGEVECERSAAAAAAFDN